MSHEINDNVKHNKAEAPAEGLNLLSVNESDKKVGQTNEGSDSHSALLEANEKEIAAAKERVAEIARRVSMMALNGEHALLESVKEWARRGAAAGEPAYTELAKHLGV